MDEIRPWLYIGKYRDTKDRDLLAYHKIDAMLQFAEEIKQPGIETLYLPVDDGVPIFPEYLQKGIKFTFDQKGLGHRVLISCGAGMSRSSAFVVASLVLDEKLSLLDALIEVKHYHPDTMIHPALWTSLCEYFGEKVSYQDAFRIMTSDMIL